jgi:hypothetical protein
MPTQAVVRQHNVLEQIGLRFFTNMVVAAHDQPGLQGGEEIFIGALFRQSPLRLVHTVMPRAVGTQR